MRSLPGDIVIMVQGDEPLLMPQAVEQVSRPLLDDPLVHCTNLLSPLESDDDLTNPNIIKAACDQRGDLLFLSRAPIPYYRKPVVCPLYRQTGIMAFRADLLRTFSRLPETPFERAEAVDMLRLLEHGHAIRGVVVDYVTVGVDRPEHVPVVERLLRDDPVQRALYDRTVGAARP